MDKERLFCQTLKVMVRLKKAIDLGFPTYCIDKLDAQVGACIDELEHNGLVDEYMEYVLK